MSHGEEWIVPLNLITITAFVVVWMITFPLWTTLLLALPLALILAFLGIDKYGGMQIVLFVAPGCLVATVGIARSYLVAIATQSELNIGNLVLQFFGKIAGMVVILLMISTALFGVLIGWEWYSQKLGVTRQIKTNELLPMPDSSEEPDSRAK